MQSDRAVAGSDVESGMDEYVLLWVFAEIAEIEGDMRSQRSRLIRFGDAG